MCVLCYSVKTRPSQTFYPMDTNWMIVLQCWPNIILIYTLIQRYANTWSAIVILDKKLEYDINLYTALYHLVKISFNFLLQGNYPDNMSHYNGLSKQHTGITQLITNHYVKYQPKAKHTSGNHVRPHYCYSSLPHKNNNMKRSTSLLLPN